MEAMTGGAPGGAANRSVRIELKENVTYQNAPTLLDGLLAYLRQGVTHVRLDMARVEFIDSAGVGMMLRAAKAFAGAGGELSLASPTPMLLRILKIVKLDRVLRVEG
jgi:anti-sigma B factor antagonist